MQAHCCFSASHWRRSRQRIQVTYHKLKSQTHHAFLENEKRAHGRISCRLAFCMRCGNTTVHAQFLPVSAPREPALPTLGVRLRGRRGNTRGGLRGAIANGLSLNEVKWATKTSQHSQLVSDRCSWLIAVRVIAIGAPSHHALNRLHDLQERSTRNISDVR